MEEKTNEDLAREDAHFVFGALSFIRQGKLGWQKVAKTLEDRFPDQFGPGPHLGVKPSPDTGNRVEFEVECEEPSERG